MLKRMLANAGADDTESADNRRATLSDIRLAGNVIKMDPAALGIFYDALCTQNKAVFFIGKRCKNPLKLFSAEFLGGFCAEANKYLISVVMVMMSVFTVVMVMMVALAIRIITFVLMMMLVVLVAAVAAVVVMAA